VLRDVEALGIRIDADVSAQSLVRQRIERCARELEHVELALAAIDREEAPRAPPSSESARPPPAATHTTVSARGCERRELRSRVLVAAA